MTKITDAQFKALWAAFKRQGAMYGRTGGLMGGAYRRMCERMARERLLNDRPPFTITLKGMHALHDACRARWAKSGSMADQQNLTEVEAVMNPPAVAPAPAMRPYQIETQKAIAALIRRPTSDAVEMLIETSTTAAAMANEKMTFDRAVEFVSRFTARPVHRDHIRTFLDVIASMTADDFDRLDEIRCYLRGESL